MKPLLLISTAVLLAFTARAADLPAVLAAPRHRLETADFRVVGRLVRVDASGARATLPISIAAHGFPGVLRVWIETGKPQRAHILLEMHSNGQTAVLVAHPGDKVAAALPFAQWLDGPFGPGFSYEDFLEEQYLWPGQTLVQQTRYGARMCDVLESTPGAGDRTHYAAIRTWLDSTIDFPVYEEKTLKGSGTVKEFTYQDVRHEEGVWSAKQVEEKTKGQTGSTLLIIDRGTPKANLKLGNFNPGDLTRFQD